jgi:nucleotide-binding universal stress UspA family protein
MTTEAREGDNSATQIAEPIPIRKILVPIDGSQFSLDTAKYTMKIAKGDNSQIICIYVITSLTLEYANAQAHVNLKKEAESWFNTIKDMAKTSSVSEVKTEILMDVHSVAESILDYVTIEHKDLIVMRTRGRTGLKKFLMGSVANDVVRHAHSPILLVR